MTKNVKININKEEGKIGISMVKSGRDKKGSDVLARYVVICIAAAIISFSVIPILGLATQQTGDTVTVTVNAPEYVEGTFDAAIDVDSIVDFNSKPTPKPAVPGFEAIFAIVGMLSIAYILQRRR